MQNKWGKGLEQIMIDERDTVIEYFYGEYKKGILGKIIPMKVFIYKDSVQGEGLICNGGDLPSKSVEYDIKYCYIKNISLNEFSKGKYISIEYQSNTVRADVPNSTIILLGIKQIEKCFEVLNNTYKEFAKAEEQRKVKEALDKRKRDNENLIYEKKASEFYDKCYEFHIQKDTPVYKLLNENNKSVLIYLDENRNLNFLKIDGYGREETNGLILYNDIHYYEKAGNIHYVSNIHSEYSNYVGGITGGTISKLATVGGGALFGLLGMGIGAVLSYKPIQQEPSESHFTIDSDINKIDERSTILNFYSDVKKQYVDITLPQDIFNFFQTYIPEKKKDIVDELEKRTIVNQSSDVIANGDLLKVPANLNGTESKGNVCNNVEDDFIDRVNKLKVMKESGLLTDDEFNELKGKLLDSI